MNIGKLLRNVFAIPEEDIDDRPTVVRDNGQPVLDKRDVEDPVGKFTGLRHVYNVYKSSSQRRRNATFFKSEYDLPTIANAVQLDGLLRRSVNLFVEQILKNGYEFKSKTDSYQRHIRRRIREIENLTGISFYEVMSQIATQLVTYGNCYVIKVRNRDKSKLGRQYRLFGKQQNPIVGLFIADASTMEIGLNTSGKVVNYMQRVRGELRIWDERDVIHLTYNKIPGTLTGMSAILPVLDDVRALRKLEEEIEILGFQYSVPLYLYKVGNKDIPPAPGEVDAVSNTVTNMPAYGMLVVPGHHTIEVPSNENTPVDVMKFIEHFKKRIFGGLGVSPVAMGESSTSNRNTSEVLDKSMQSITKSYQQIIKNKIEMELLRELLLDGGFNNLNNSVEFSFPEIDIENQIKKETHILSLWQNNLITRTEARVIMDYDANIDESDTFLTKVDMPMVQTEGDIQLEATKITAKAAAQRATTSSKSSSSSAKKKKTTSNKVRPTNQHGTSTGRPKFKRDSYQLNLFDGLSLFNKQEFLNGIIVSWESDFKKNLTQVITDYCNFFHFDQPKLDEGIINMYLDGIKLILKNKADLAIRELDDELKFGHLSKMATSFLYRQDEKIDNLAKILLYKSFGYKTILVTANDCSLHTDVNLEIDKISYSDIPPFGYKCNCEVEEESFHEFL